MALTEPTAHLPAPSDSSESDSGHFSAYNDHAKTLRTWLVAYGIGSPVLLVSQEAIWIKLVEAGVLRLMTIFFLFGVALQVVLAAVNKSAMWACYYGEIDAKFKESRRYKLGCWLSERYFIDFLCDVFAIGVFAFATYLGIEALIPA